MPGHHLHRIFPAGGSEFSYTCESSGSNVTSGLQLNLSYFYRVELGLGEILHLANFEASLVHELAIYFLHCSENVRQEVDLSSVDKAYTVLEVTSGRSDTLSELSE